MFQYTRRRILISIPILLVVLTLVFVVVRVLPGDPAVAALGDQASKEAVDALRARMGLNDPLWLQCLKFLGSLCRGGLGTSIITGYPVARQIASVTPYTLELTFAAVILGYLFGIPLGISAAVRRNSFVDYFNRVFSLVGLSGSPVDRGSIMAALEAAAEAVVAAEAAAESADQAEAAADIAETAAELIVGRVDADEEADHEAEAALAARMVAGGLEREPSLADRLASLLPGAGSAEADATPTTTQVVVTGLVSVASIASFKRHLGRAHGVQSVTVASGPDGEFVFNVTHRTDAGLRDAIPTLPGFGARVTGTGDGVLNVAARDPEAEG